MAKTYTAEQIADYFLVKSDESRDPISNLKLQKLCYYAQGIGLAVRGQPMFEERISAWMHGPVVPDLWRRYRDFGSAPITLGRDVDLSVFDEADRMILDDVFTYYGQYSAWRLREMTHTEAPWKNNANTYGGGTITNEELVQFFSEQVSDEYRRAYEEEVSRREGKAQPV